MLHVWFNIIYIIMLCHERHSLRKTMFYYHVGLSSAHRNPTTFYGKFIGLREFMLSPVSRLIQMNKFLDRYWRRSGWVAVDDFFFLISKPHDISICLRNRKITIIISIINELFCWRLTIHLRRKINNITVIIRRQIENL